MAVLNFVTVIAFLALLSSAEGKACMDSQGCSFGSFCGSDGECKTYNCENYFNFGPPEFTGYDTMGPPGPAGTPELTCEPSEGTSSPSASFGCTSIADISLDFNQVCTAKPKPGLIFECWDQNMVDTTTYKAEVEASTLTCDVTGYPAHSYSIIFSRTIEGPDGKIDAQTVTAGGVIEAGPVLNEGYVATTMFSTLVSEVKTDAPPSPMAEPAAVEPTDAGASSKIDLLCLAIATVCVISMLS